MEQKVQNKLKSTVKAYMEVDVDWTEYALLLV